MNRSKAFMFSLTAIAAFSLLMAACSKSNSNNIPVGMSSQISGQAYLAKLATGTSYGGYYTVTGTGTVGGDTVALVVYLYAPFILNQKVSSDTSAAEIDYSIFKNNSPYAIYAASNAYGGHAYYTVTSLDTIQHKIVGTFSGTIPITSNVGNLPDSVIVANGQFNTTYQ